MPRNLLGFAANQRTRYLYKDNVAEPFNVDVGPEDDDKEAGVL